MSANVYGTLDRVANGWRKAMGVASLPNVPKTTQKRPATFTKALQTGVGPTTFGSDASLNAPPMGVSAIPIPEVKSPTINLPDLSSVGRGIGPNSGSLLSNIPSKSQIDQRYQELFGPKDTGTGQEQWGSGEGNYDSGEGRGLSGVKQWDQQIKAAAKEFGLPWQVIASIMGIESGGNPRVVSVAGARGLMQIMPEYWQYLADQYDGNLMNPETNIKVGAQILKILYDQYGSWDKAAAAYLGAIDEYGNITSAPDAYGTTGHIYVDLFNQNMRALGYGAPSQAEAAAGGAPATSQAVQAMNFVMNETIGIPYVWGGADLNGFDCSGLTLWAYAKAGIRLPRTAADQYNYTQRVDHNNVQPGDLVFFANTNGPGITHVGIYIGNGQFVHAPTEGKTVQVTSLNDPFWGKHIAGYGRAY